MVPRKLVFLAMAVVAVLRVLPARSDLMPGDVRAALEGIIGQARLDEMRWPDFSDDREWVRGFYEKRGWTFAWTSEGRTTVQARAVIVALETAGDKGLRAGDYDGTRWAGRVAAFDSGGTSSLEDLAGFDLALTVNVMRHVSDLHIGRINPVHMGFHLDIEPKKYDLTVLVNDLAASDRVEEMLETVEPQYANYRLLKQTLRRYRELADEFALWEPLPVPAQSVKPGSAYGTMPRLAELLVALGDLSEDRKAEASDSHYGPAMVEAIQRFQARHGLAGDGVIGTRTFAELNVPLQHRVQQVELALERWRWLPHEVLEPPIVVNIPAFRLRAYDIQDGRAKLELSMNVIVGKEFPRLQTPVFAKQMRHVIFSPYWEVPPSIARKELLPKFEKDPGYAAGNDYIIEGPGGRLRVDAESIALVRAGKARIRQKPGPKNALGAVKFVFPNEFNVYLHSTPTPSLFGRSERALSHGCVRVENPLGLAEYVMRNDSSWTRARIEAAMASGNPETVVLRKPIWVYIVYSTAVLGEGSTVRFLRDVYGHDAKLIAALEKGYPYLP